MLGTLVDTASSPGRAPNDPGQEEMLGGFDEVVKYSLIEVDRLQAKIRKEIKAGRKK
jgi:hypothetical protein